MLGTSPEGPDRSLNEELEKSMTKKRQDEPRFSVEDARSQLLRLLQRGRKLAQSSCSEDDFANWSADVCDTVDGAFGRDSHKAIRMFRILQDATGGTRVIEYDCPVYQDPAALQAGLGQALNLLATWVEDAGT